MPTLRFFAIAFAFGLLVSLAGCTGAAPCEGDVGCPCDEDSACFNGNTCQAGVCVAPPPAEPDVGDPGGACYANGTCNAGGSCEDGVCVACETGTVACACFDNNTCLEGLTCDRGMCTRPEGSRIPPEDPTCYSPCRSSFTDAMGTFRYCDADGLMEGCRGDNVCVEGTCQPTEALSSPQAAVGDCTTDIDCPDYQTCIQGRCYSNCSADPHCTDETYGEEGCFRHVCRPRCDTATPCTLPDTYCDTTTGEAGFCLPTAPSEGDNVEANGVFFLSERYLAFTNVKIEDRFYLVNESARDETFVIKKASGPEIVDGSPMHWIEMGCTDGCLADEAGLAQVDEIEISVAGEGGVVEITLAEVANDNEPQWNGSITVSNERMGTRDLRLSYVSLPEGQWSGRMFYFANFPEQKIDEWREDKDNPALLNQLNNAFLRKWQNFMEGGLSLDEFEALVATTQTESWRSALMDEYCPEENVACYPYDNANGYSVYSSALDQFEIPTGGNELPMVMNLALDDADPTLLSGRIVTGETLHYPGDPAVQVRFEGDPTSCVPNARGVTICRMAEFSSSVLVGGRYLTDENGTDCALGPQDMDGSTYELHRIPWLVPGFEQNTVFEPDPGLRYRYECRDPLLPLANADGAPLTDDQKAINAALAEANPIPDGRTRERHLRLLDGAMIDQTEMVILFEETFASFLDDDDASGFSAYGIVRLSRTPAQLDEQAFQGNVQQEDRTAGDEILNVQCSDELLGEIADLTGQSFDPADPASAAELAEILVNGQVATTTPLVTISGTTTPEHVHWWCEATNTIDGGPDGDIPCPAGSNVRYFTVNGMAPTDVSEHSCNDSFSAASIARNSELEYLQCKDGSPDCDCRDDPSLCQPCDPGANDDPSPGGSVCYPRLLDANYELWSVDVETPGACLSQINTWNQDDGSGNADGVEVRWDPIWRCAETSPGVRPSFCSVSFGSNGTPVIDRRVGRDFYPESESAAVFGAIRDEIALAFRYKTQFRSRSGKNIGFTPEICVEGSTAIPYCYDPDSMEDILQRVDCAAAIYTAHVDTAEFDTVLPGTALKPKDLLRSYLTLNFGVEEIRFNPSNPGELLPFPIVNDGFERLYSELLIMLGDEAFTKAFASRFDLAGANILSFEGSLFEPGGIDLSGGAGFELYTLYQSAQYYQLALDRFYKLSPIIWDSLAELGGTEEDGFIDDVTVTAYFERLIRASTQKARAMSEIASRYRDFNEPALARLVVERAYTSTYLESIVLSRMMLRLLDEGVVGNAAPQIRRSVEKAQLTYRSALLRMRDVYESITDNVNFFGYAPDYIPFPALDEGEGNAFEVILASVRDKLDTAAVKEDLALESNRSFETDAAAFQAELVDIRNNYEDQLADVCGTFTGGPPGEEQVYPAIRKYAHLTDVGLVAGDPCGFVGNGEIHQAYGDLELARLDLVSAQTALRNQQALLQAEAQRVADFCGLVVEEAQYNFEVDQDINEYNETIRLNEAIRDEADRMIGQMSALTELAACVTGVADNCITSAAAATALTAGYVVFNTTAIVTSGIIVDSQNEIDDLEDSRAFWNTLQECEYAKVESNAVTKGLILEDKLLQIEAFRKMEEVNLMLSRIESLRNKAKRLQDQQEESQQLAINIEAARNDPNVRIYKNDAILTADRTFERALREAYRLTKVYEYYTSTSYAYLGDLFLVRLVSRGDISLEQYVDELEDAFSEFEELYGNPDDRVLVLSLRDDVLGIPRVDGDELPLSTDARDQAFRQAFFDPTRLNDDGYVSISFPITVDQVSPLTRNHKVESIELEVLGDDRDDVFRAYLRQRGTGVVRSVEGDKAFYGFPKRTAVVNAFLNNQRPFGLYSPVYTNRRLKDRPLVNTQWELLVNFQDETDNLDLDKSSLKDIRVYFFYTDFTEL